MLDPRMIETEVYKLPCEDFRKLLRELRGEDREQTSVMSIMVTTGPDYLTADQVDELRATISGYLPDALLTTTEDVALVAAAIAGRSVKIV